MIDRKLRTRLLLLGVLAPVLTAFALAGACKDPAPRPKPPKPVQK